MKTTFDSEEYIKTLGEELVNGLNNIEDFDYYFDKV